MAITIGVTGIGSYGISDKNSNYGGGFEISDGNTNGKSWFVSDVGVGIGATKGGVGCAGARLKLGGEVPFTKTGCGSWFTTSGMIIYGEGKFTGNFTPTKETGTARDGQYEYKVDGGGGIEFGYRTPYFDGAIGAKGGYKKENIFSADKELREECGRGQAYVGPTIRAQVFIPRTQYRTDILGGLGIGVKGLYDALHNQLEGCLTLSYTF